MRFPRPVFIGDTVTAQIAVEDVRLRDEDTGVATFAVTVVNQRSEVVQTFRMRILGRRARAVAALPASGSLTAESAPPSPVQGAHHDA
jgi:hypothetical protein